MTLRTDEGRTAEVTATRRYTDHVRTYNLTVEGVHTYYAPAGRTPLLVHNSDDVCGVWKGEFDKLPKGKQSHVREMDSAEDMRKAFDRWTTGAEKLPARGPKIPDVYKLQDGTVIQWRNASRSGGETIDIFPSGGKGMKVRLPGE